jgi:spermidine synthase
MCAQRREQGPGYATPDVRLVCDRGRQALLAGGVVQSIDVDSADASDYWTAMLPDTRPARALLLGAGGGTLAALLLHRFGSMAVVAVDDDPAVVRLGRATFYLDLPDVSVILADAFQFAAACPGRFEYIAVDLFRGGERPRELLGRPFLRDLRRIAAPNAVVAFNLFRDRRTEQAITRIARSLAVTRRVSAGKNVVLHCRVR